MSNLPKKLTKAELVEVLRDILASVEADDSFDGTINYSATSERHVFEVAAFYRVGSSMGQGGSVVIDGSLVHSPDEVPANG